MRTLFVVPGGVDGVTGGNLYDAAAMAALRSRGWRVDVGATADEAVADVVVVDSLAFHAGPPRTDAGTIALVHQIPSEAAGRDITPSERETLLAADVVVTVSDWLAERVHALGAERVEIARPGRDRAWAREGPRADAATVLCVANAFPGKGVPEAISAFSRVPRPGVALELVGDLEREPQEAARVRSALDAARAGIRTSGVLPGAVLASRYATAIALLTASRYEGWPIATAEAMASGLPVVGFRVPGTEEVVGDAGLLVDPGDVDALSDALARVIADPRLRASIGARARDRALAWPTWQQSASRFADIVERLAGQESRAANAP